MPKVSLDPRTPVRAMGMLIFLAALAASFINQSIAAGAGPTTGPALSADDMPKLAIGHFSVRYLRDRKDLPATREVLTHTTFMLRRVEGGFAGPQAGLPFSMYRFDDPALEGARFSQSAIKYIQEGVRDYMSTRGLIAIFVYAADTRAKDTPNGPDALLSTYSALAGNSKPIDVQMVIVVGIAKDIRAIASGDRGNFFPFLQGARAKAEKSIKANSPIKTNGVFYQDPLQDYLAQLNRQPGRHVDISLSSADSVNEDDVEMDYLIHFSKPWTAYVEAYNTGTRQTNEWQERFGFIDDELTGNDDVFSVDFNTSSFADNYSFTSAYDAPLFGLQRVRGRVYGSFGKFASSDLGLNGESLDGRSDELGAETSLNVYQHRQLFVDLVAGARVDSYFVGVKVPPTGGSPSMAEAGFLFPYVGAEMTSATDAAATAAAFNVLFDSQNPNSPNRDTLNKLGRLDVNRNYTILQGSASEAFFIEPLFSDWETRDRQLHPTAANEMYFSMKGQFTPEDKRLIPELEETAGGLYSVRGYPESAVAGDSVIYGTAEYRLHIPRLLGVAAPNALFGRTIPSPPLFGGGSGFNYQPRAADTPGDWDLILRSFVDAGYVHYNKIDLEEAGTSDAGLVGAGLGLELRLRDNVTVRADYGVALTPLHEAVGSKNALNVEPGSGRFNFVFELLY